MSEVSIIKEKNIITMNMPVGKTIRTYHLDLSTGIFTTKTGKPTEKIAGISKLSGRGWEDIIYQGIHKSNKEDAITLYAVVELLLASGLDFPTIRTMTTSYNYDTVNKFWAHKKYWSEWYKANPDETAHYGWWNTFLKFAQYKAGLAERGYWGKQLNEAQYNAILNKDARAAKSNDILEIYAYYLLNNQYFNELVSITDYVGILRLIYDYLSYCADLDKKPEKCSNAFREFAETKRTYTAMKATIDQKKFTANYEKHSKAWDFEYGDFVVVVPKEGKDLVREGQEMHHCVGSYVDKVVNGECSIVFIRHKDNPDKCYLTCQVYENGRIGQYYLAYDKYISSEEDIAFKKAFQDHLWKVWNNN